jgi:hypothetical protein
MGEVPVSKTSQEATSKKQRRRMLHRLVRRRPDSSHAHESTASKATSQTAPEQHGKANTPTMIRPWYPVLLLVAVFISAGIGALVIRWGSTSTALGRAFSDSNQFGEFTALVAGLLGLAAVVASLTWPTFCRIASKTSRPSLIAAIVLYVIMSVAIVVGPAFVESGKAIIPLPHFTLRISVVYVLVLAASCASFCGLILVTHEQRERISRAGTENAGEAISSILEARRQIQRFFGGAAALITAAVIVVGGLQSALDVDLKTYQAEFNNGDIIFLPNIAGIPAGAIILFGIFFAAMLGFALLPSYMAWRARVTDLRDRMFPIPEDGDLGQSWLEGRSNIEELLQLRSGFGPTSLAIIGILAPVVGSIVSVIIPSSFS